MLEEKKYETNLTRHRRQVDELTQHNKNQKPKRLMFGIILTLIYFIWSFADGDEITPPKLLGIDNHILDQILSSILSLPIIIYIFSLVGVVFFDDMNLEEWKNQEFNN
jgi:hypothetical protein